MISLNDDYFDVRGKVMASDSWDGLLNDLGGRMSQIVEFANGRDSMSKSASECFSREFINEMKPDDRHFMVHYVAMGAHERYGWNRNMDSFLRDELMRKHSTFVSHGAYFKEHRNHDKKYAIGTIKASAYNKHNDRVELLVEGDKKKAEEEYEKAKAGKELSGSMATKIPHDVCSICFKKSRTTRDYCEHAKHKLGRYLPEFGKYAYVTNPDPTFIDYSSVARPADRIAHYISYTFGPGNELQKAASAESIVTSSDWAAFYGQGQVNRQVEKALEKLARAGVELTDKESVKVATAKAAFLRDVVSRSQPQELTDAELDGFRRLRPPTLWYNLAKRSSVMPFRSFCGYILNKPMAEIIDDPEIKAASSMAPEIPGKLQSEVGMEFVRKMLGQFMPCGQAEADSDPEHDDAIDLLLEKADDKFSVEPVQLQDRVVHAGVIKNASDIALILLPDDSFAGTLAMAYGVYKAAALATIDSFRGESPGRDFLVAALS